MDVGPAELIIVLIIILVVFGGAKLPKLAKSLGEAQREFRKGTEGMHDDEPKVEAVAEPAPLPAASEPVSAVNPDPLGPTEVVEPQSAPSNPSGGSTST